MELQRVGHYWVTELNWIDMNYYSSIHISLGCSLWLNFCTSEASPEWSSLIYWLKLLCASLKMYCKDLFFLRLCVQQFAGFLLYADILQIIFKANQLSCLSWIFLLSTFILLIFLILIFLLSQKNCHPPLGCSNQTLGFHPLISFLLSPLTHCDDQSSSSIDFTCLNFFSFCSLSSIFIATPFF